MSWQDEEERVEHKAPMEPRIDPFDTDLMVRAGIRNLACLA